MIYTFRPTSPADISALPAIERAAAQRFALLPEFSWLAAGPVICAERHQHFVSQAMSWLALADDRPVGFLLAEAHDASLFIVEFSLHLDWQGRGLGRRLMAYAIEQAREKGFSALTLTTFRDVPWNAPWYARMGFEIVPEALLNDALRQKLREEAAHGLAAESRCAMRLALR
ncbi:GNAT family N-acetyltransferase [Kluyvera genomosp. 3]|uniref:GNAT family N-acetyltransferase n=1 Tax=Kluyvera genomosp. 3 TaxID=2774055 RepID=A0A6G9RSV3_9ENTR|nr:GNAT family N-acetyltransferase [Kluyvera genomosp. 3]QIR29029.1 GNAT family N-acetyltransferase [Kluyvera genomosp. 3]